MTSPVPTRTGISPKVASVIGMLIMLAATVVVFWPAFHGGFIWDDNALVTESWQVKSKDGLKAIWLGQDVAAYWPMTSTFFWLEWRLWGMNASGYHCVNVGLHLLNAILLWRVLRHLQIRGAWFVAFFFLIHPLCVTSAVWISELKNTLSMVFYLLAILFFLRAGEGKRGAYWISLLCFLLALLSKSSVVVLPAILLAICWWQQRRIRYADIRRTAPFFVLSLVFSVITFWFIILRHPHVVSKQDTLLVRILAGGHAVWFYLEKAFAPTQLMMIYPRWSITPDDIVAYVPLLALIALIVICWWFRERWGRAAVFALACFLIALAPVIGLLSMPYFAFSWVADHFQYIALPAVIAFAVAGMVWLCSGRRNAIVRNAPWAIALVVAITFAVISRDYASVVADRDRLWADNLEKNPAAWPAHQNIGWRLVREGKLDEGIAHLRMAQTARPNSPEVMNHLAFAIARKGNLDEAVSLVEQSLRIDPNSADWRANLGDIYSSAGRVQEAIKAYEDSLRLNPNLASVVNDLAWIFATSRDAQFRDPHRAVEFGERAAYLSGNIDPEVLDTLAAAYASDGRFVDAIAAAQRGIDLAERSNEKRVLADDMRTRLHLYEAHESYVAK